ncbi:MAG: DMT family transporter [Chloroflexota bacterium]
MKTKSIASLIGYSIAISTLGFFTRMIEGIDLMPLVFFRTLLASLFILGFLVITNRMADLIPRRPELLMFSALCQGGMMVTFIGAVLNTTITNTVFINHTAPIFAIIFSRIFLKEQIRTATILSIIISFVGMLLIIDFSDFSLQSSTALGDMMALASGVFFAGSMISAKALTRSIPSTGIAFWQMAITAGVIFPFIDIPSVEILIPVAFPLIGMGCFATGLSYIMFMVGVENLDAQVVLIVPTIGLIFPAVGAWIIYSEALTAVGILGCILILVGVLTSQMNLVGESSPSHPQTTSIPQQL